MHGIGNDFVVVDARHRPFEPDAGTVAAMGDRRRGIGFDQLLVIVPARAAGHVAGYRIWNRDGSRAGQCGNGARCVVRWLARAGALGPGPQVLESPAGPLEVEMRRDGHVRVVLGEPDFDPAAVPLDLAADGLAPRGGGWQLELAGQALQFEALSLGNPHAVLEVATLGTGLADAPVATLGPALQAHRAFPERCNIGFAEIRSRTELGLRVFERGAGETLACGSGAAAAMAALRRNGRVDASVMVALAGGRLQIDWSGPGQPLAMTGPAEFSFEGTWPAAAPVSCATRRAAPARRGTP